jgi:DNA adenine methylase Dam
MREKPLHQTIRNWFLLQRLVLKMYRDVIRSPFFYVGDKYKLMPQLRRLFPDYISTYIEPFAGGGSSFLNTEAESYIVNDVNYYIISLHKCLCSYAGNKDKFLEILYDMIDRYGLSCSYRGITVPDELKKKYIKTYYSHYNKAAYERLRDDFNRNGDMFSLYLLLIYGFNHMIRFNRSGKFNLPVGNVDFNKNVYAAICHYLDFMEQRDVSFYNMDFKQFLDTIRLDEGSYIYLDPPYLISGSEYNKYWNESDEQRLCSCLDMLNAKGVRFGITNLINHKGKTNKTFLEWSKKYFIYNISSNYISFNDNTVKSDSKEVFVTNYGKE